MERVNLLTGELSDHVALGLKGIRDGYVICAPLENGYVFLADAFSEFAVRAMHVLRGDELGVKAQVLIHSSTTLPGLTPHVSDEVKLLVDAFWPGPLSLNLHQSVGLNWNLGDDNSLDLFSVRVPSALFVSALLKESGPLAVASAARKGMKPALTTAEIIASEADLAVIFDAGELVAGTQTTVVQSDIDGLTIIREGALSRQQLAAVVPALSALSE
jgi:tRNA threonylcarbamoyl adenosine modification protein (Sua5/YciO/YrdC/YwlC family)